MVVYVLTRFRSETNRRVINFLRLRSYFSSVVLVHQADGRASASGEELEIRQPLKPTSVLKLAGLPRLERWLDQQLYFPTSGIIYAKAAEAVLQDRIGQDLEQGRSVCLITTVPPHDLTLTGLALKRRHPEIRWIVDWRDLWSFDASYLGRTPRRKHARVRSVEDAVLNACDMNVVTNSRAEILLRERLGPGSVRVMTIRHAFDPPARDAGTGAAGPNGKGILHVGFLGSLFKPPKVPGVKVLEALDHVRSRGVPIEFLVIGDRHLERTSGAPLGDRSWIRWWPRLPHDESLRMAARADVLLLVLDSVPNSEAIVHGKLPFYLALNRPVVALVPSGSAVAEALSETGAGVVVPVDGHWGEGLERALVQLQAGVAPERDAGKVQRYSWEAAGPRWRDLILGSEEVLADG